MQMSTDKFMLCKNKILVVEDEDVCLHVVCTFLKGAGANVDTSTNAEDAIEKLGRKQYDLVLSDIKLPGKSGIDLLGFIKNNSIDVSVILMTGHMELSLAVDALRLGAHDYLLKPFSDNNHLIEAVSKAIKNHELQKKIKLLQRKVRHHGQLLRLLFDRIEDALFICELDKNKGTAGKIIKMNQAAANILAFCGKDKTGTLMMTDLILPEYLPEFVDHIRETIKNKSHTVEIAVGDRNGNSRFVEIVSTLISEGKNYYVISSARDASGRIAFEKQVADSSEKIRSQLAEELHDALSQDISSISLLIACLKKKLKKSENTVIKDVISLEFLSQRALLSIRRMLFNLFPTNIEKMKLPEILEHLAATEERLFKVNCRFECDKCMRNVTGEAVKKHIYRIAQEAIANACRHGNVNQIVIKLFPQDGMNVLSIEYNGGGFSKADGKKDMGICIMRHRARVIGAKLDITAQKNKGTAVVCKWKAENE